MTYVNEMLSLFRFLEHGTFIILSFILFNDNNNNKNNNDLMLGLKIYVSVSFVIVFGLYFYIVVYDEAVKNKSSTINQTLQQLLELEMYDQIVEMCVFGFKYSDQDWRELVQNKAVRNYKIVHALSAFLSHGVIEADNIFSAIELAINTQQDRHGKTVLHYAADDHHGSVKCVSKLLQCHANPNVKCSDGWTPLTLAIIRSNGSDRLSKMDLLLKANADVNLETDGRTPLQHATSDISRHDCIDMLLGATNIMVNKIDRKGQTSLDIAVAPVNTEDRRLQSKVRLPNCYLWVENMLKRLNKRMIPCAKARRTRIKRDATNIILYSYV